MFGLLMMRNLLILPVIILIAGCNLDVCNNLISSELNSPTNAYIATTFTRGCGATTPTLAIVSIRKKNAEFNADNYNNWVFSVKSDKEAKINWLDSNTLKILYVWQGEQPTRKKKRWNGVAIIY